MDTLEEQVLEGLRSLPLDKQLAILDFVEFLKLRSTQPTASQESKPLNPPLAAGLPSRQWPPGTTLLDITREVVGSIEGGPDDLPNNPKYMEGFGE